MGRSAYLCPTADCLDAAQKKNRLGRALKAPVPAAIYQTLRDRLAGTPTSATGTTHSTPSQTKGGEDNV